MSRAAEQDAMRWLAWQADVPRHVPAVLLAIARATMPETGTCSHSVAALAEASGYGERSVQTAKAWLIRVGYLIVVQQGWCNRKTHDRSPAVLRLAGRCFRHVYRSVKDAWRHQIACLNRQFAPVKQSGSYPLFFTRPRARPGRTRAMNRESGAMTRADNERIMTRTSLRNDLLMLDRHRLINFYAARRAEAGMAAERIGSLQATCLEFWSRYDEAEIAAALAWLGAEGRWHTVMPGDVAGHIEVARASAARAAAGAKEPQPLYSLTLAARAKKTGITKARDPAEPGGGLDSE